MSMRGKQAKAQAEWYAGQRMRQRTNMRLSKLGMPDLHHLKGVIPLPKWAVVNAQVKRKPDGFACRILAVRTSEALIRGCGGSTSSWVSALTLMEKWTPCGARFEPLRELLTRMRSVHPGDLPASLRDLRKAWLDAGCPGL
jgi:hypothetical protein